MRRSVFLTLLLLLAFTALGGLTLWWFFLATYAERVVETQFEQWREDGLDAAHGGITWHGFPFRIRLAVAAPHAHLPPDASGIGWEAEQAILESPLSAPRDVAFELPGPVRAVWRPGDGSPTRILDARDGSGEARPGRDIPGWWGRIELRDAALMIDGVDGPVLQADRAEAEAHVPPTGRGMLDASLALHDGRIAADAPWGDAFETAFLAGAAPMPLPRRWTREELAAWRDAGGRLDVQQIALLWGPVGVTAGGTVGIDDAVRAAGVMTTELDGHRELLAVLRDRGVIGADAAELGGGVLDMIAAASGGRIRAPLRFEPGGVMLGPIRLGDNPPLAQR